MKQASYLKILDGVGEDSRIFFGSKKKIKEFLDLVASKLHYIHKIERDDGTNVYIVHENLYLETIDKIKK